ncbi:hypothetical protein TEQG_08776 [Trichophyton equinum CBS 127.97]|uniref:Uncharacterized protein n=1 Tax=Trichophyton equinum (strain ATCC MYA-4606 / CBS 127.97) TaxID=559882 RepID=F2Q1J3_TRIEC|nr:hypothetical protein TEQG_08776 [Trichophyton equinum CBS 127.97]
MSTASGHTTDPNQVLVQLKQQLVALERKVASQDCEDEIEQCETQIKGLSDEIRILKARTGDTKASVKIQTPNTFNRERNKLEHFLSECDIYLATKLGITEVKKVIFTESYLHNTLDSINTRSCLLD